MQDFKCQVGKGFHSLFGERCILRLTSSSEAGVKASRKFTAEGRSELSLQSVRRRYFVSNVFNLVDEEVTIILS